NEKSHFSQRDPNNTKVTKVIVKPATTRREEEVTNEKSHFSQRDPNNTKVTRVQVYSGPLPPATSRREEEGPKLNEDFLNEAIRYLTSPLKMISSTK
ncbi:hypothetical protein DID78_05320, partial [Candidatus Marinamargulisbacteria bacterium SCGC AG-343-D04]